MPTTDMISPPMVPATNGNQKLYTLSGIDSGKSEGAQ